MTTYMNDKKAYRITTEYGSYVDYLDDADVERMRRKYHGFVSIERWQPIRTCDFDWDKIADDIRKEANDLPR